MASLVEVIIALLCFNSVIWFLEGSPFGRINFKVREKRRYCHYRDEYYHRKTNRCYLLESARERGPCGKNMTLAPVGTTLVATCKCQDYLDLRQCVPGADRDVIDQFCKQQRLVVWPDGTGCSNNFEKGPCAEGTWLVGLNESTSKCLPNNCQSGMLSQAEPYFAGNDFVFSVDGSCYRTFTQGFCKQGEILQFSNPFQRPSCSPKLVAFLLQRDHISRNTGVNIHDISCQAGKMRDVNGGCQTLASVNDYEE